jgi:AraC-like DNA-binding protein
MGTRELPSRFSIVHRGPAKGPAYDAWREGVCRGFCQLDVSPAEDDFIDCHNDFALLDCVAMATPRGRSARFARTRELLRDDCDDLVLISATTGPTRVTQAGEVIELSAGQMCLTEMNVIGSAELTSSGGFTTTRFPRRLLLQVSPFAEDCVAKPLAYDPAWSMMIGRYFALCNDMAGDLDALGSKTAALHLADLVGLFLATAYGQQNLSDRHDLSAVRLDLLKADTLRKLDRPDLSADAIGRANGISARQVQRLFAHGGITFSEFVLEQRLSWARRLLLAPNRSSRISEIAYAAGFNDLSYFNRSFKKRFGVAPSDLLAEPHRR